MVGKLGFGVYNDFSDTVRDVQFANGRAVLLAGSALKLAERIRRAVPGIIIVGREVLDDDRQRALLLQSSDPQRGGYMWADSLVKRYPQVDYWCGLNEVYRDRSKTILQQQVKFESGMADRFLKSNDGLIAFNFATGTWPMPDEGLREFVTDIKPLLAKPRVKLGIHVYGSPEKKVMNSSVDRKWHGERFIPLLKELRTQMAENFKGMVITEFGQYAGYRGLTRLIPGPGGFAAWEDDAKWLAKTLTYFSDVEWAVNFLHGTDDPDTWNRFDTFRTDAPNTLKAFNKAYLIDLSRPPEPAQPEAPSEPETPKEGTVLSDSDKAKVLAAVDSLWSDSNELLEIGDVLYRIEHEEEGEIINRVAHNLRFQIHTIKERTGLNLG